MVFLTRQEGDWSVKNQPERISDFYWIFMKNIFLLNLLVMTFLMVQCGNHGKKSASGPGGADTGKAKIVFREYEHHFGKVTEGEKVSYIFRFENQGTANLIIESALTTCGCTVPEFDRKPIPPGGNGDLEVVFNTSGKEGMQTKTITVKSNASAPVVLLKITADVESNDK